MVEIEAVKKPSDVNPKEPTEEKTVELEPEDFEEEEVAEVIDATEKADKVKIIFEFPKRMAQKLKDICAMLDVTQREFITEAVTEKIAKIEDISYLDEFNLQNPYIKVDDLIAFLKNKQVIILTPKALKRICKALKGKWAISLGKDKWVEFCEKLGLDPEEVEATDHAYIIHWKR
ncbi:MAG: hypothetical protein QXG39_07490 [Candidatus Aenigmatarchaeota archaeon]